MSASEFAFLALGLVLGVATGAALIEVLRARPHAPREVRVTVTPGSVPPRRIPATLAEDPFAGPTPMPALDDHDVDPFERPSSPGARTIVRNRALVPEFTATAWPSRDSSAGASPRRMVGIPIHRERDQFLARLTGVGGAAAAVAVLDPPTQVVATAEPDTPAGPAATDRPGAGETGPCGELHRLADERCALADRARDQAQTAQAAIREAQRAYDDHLARADQGAVSADPRNLQQAKELAHGAFRRAREARRTPEEEEAAAREWLQEINRINNEAREAGILAQRERDAANALVTVIERLSLEADAARISAEAAAEACVAARQAAADCDEASATEGGPARSPVPLSDARLGEVAVSRTDPERDAFAASAGEAVILRLLRGDRDARAALVERLAGDDPAERRRWQRLLSDLTDAILGRAIEAGSLQFPEDHPFWAPNTRAQNRDIVNALASLGYRFDGLGRFADDRVPSQRDLSLAVGYAGLDPKRIRHWPTESETAALMADVTVTADEYLTESAPTLSLGELVELLGRRADGLAELWNAWGRVRPLLLAAG